MAINLDEIDSLYEHIMKVMENNIKASVFYSIFLHKVARDSFYAHETYLNTRMLLDNYYVNKKRWENSEDVIAGSGSSAVVLISGNKSNLGVVQNANHELFEILGYDKKEILGQKITITMPQMIGTYHNKFIENYYTKASPANLKERVVFPQHAKGYLTPSSILVRLVPNLDNGIQLIGFISKLANVDKLREGDSNILSEDLVLMLTDQDTKIYGFNKKFAELLSPDIENLNIQKYLESDQKFELQTLYPNIFTPENNVFMCSPDGYSCQINLNQLIEAFRIEVMENFCRDAEEINETLPENVFLDKKEYYNYNVNIKVKDSNLLGGQLKYRIYTFYFDRASQLGLNNLETDANEGKNKESNKKNEIDTAILEAEGSVSQTTSSSCK